jgi:predicted transcriptional regulator
MARKRSPILTEGELRLMNILWEKGTATVKEVVDALPSDQRLAYTTVLTTMQNLEKKAVIAHTEKGRAFVYYPVVHQDEAQQKATRYIINRFFNDSPDQLVLNILEHEEIDAATLARLRKLLEESES